MPDLTHVTAASAYHNWLEHTDTKHSPEREHAFFAAWDIVGNFIEGPEQKAVDWSVVSDAVHDAIDEDGVGASDLEASFKKNHLLVLHSREDSLEDLAPFKLAKRPVAFRVKDHADGWIIFQDEDAANKEAEVAGSLMQGLYVRDGK